jgi:hypothetical protein
MNSADAERFDRMDAEQDRQLDEALARMRTAFADVPEEQLLQDVVEIIERDRQERRQKASEQKSA